jgi:hypothetical protein
MRNSPTKTSLVRIHLCALAFLFSGGLASKLHAQDLNTAAIRLPDTAVLEVPAKAVDPKGTPSTDDSAVTGQLSVWDNLFSNGSPFFFGLIVGEMYDDNIFISPQKSGDFITHVTPTIDFVEGDKTAANANYFNVVFRPTLFFYQNNPAQNRQDYFADAIYQHQWTRLTLSLAQRYENLTDPSIDTGNFFKRQIYTTTFSGSYFVDDKLSVAGSEIQRLSYFPNQAISSTSEWITDLYALYQVAPKLSLGIGPRIGFVDIAGAPNQTYQDLLLRLSYQASEKISLSFEGGGEYRQFEGNPDRLYPIFDLNATYTPFDGTAISLSAYRQEVVSYEEIGDDYVSTLVQANFKQRFLTNFFFLAAAGYTFNDYEATSGQGTGQNSGAGRRDNYFYLNGGVEWDPREWLSISGRYQYSEDDSTFSQNSFNDNQFDLQAGVQF